jgi:hypothetical protein
VPCFHAEIGINPSPDHPILRIPSTVKNVAAVVIDALQEARALLHR